MDTHINPAVPAASPGSSSSGIDLRAYVDHNSKMRESADISKIAPALVHAQAAMESPPRNRSVQVRTQAGSYTFRYATLDKITDMMRTALAENGLCVLQPIVNSERGAALVTRLLHESGQWMECEITLPALGNSPQAFGSIVTYVRRYAISALLNISADEDDDANRAAGNHYADVAPKGAPGLAPGAARKGQGRAEAPSRDEAAPSAAAAPGSSGAAQAVAPEDRARGLVNRARVAESVEDGHALLEAWQRDAPWLETLRGEKGWEALERELGAGLKRSLGSEPAAAFVVALRAADTQQVAALQQHWEGKWSDTLSAMQQEAPATYALLRRHVAAQIARVRAAVGEATAAPAAAKAAPDFEAHLRDDTGEVASDPIATPLAFARAYAELWQATDADARTALARHNAKALGQAVQDAAAREVLNALGGGPDAGASAGAPQRRDRADVRDRGQAHDPAGPSTRAPSPQGGNGAKQAGTSRPLRRGESPGSAPLWTIVRPGKEALTVQDGPAWLAWWREQAAEAAAQGREDALQALSDANAATWDRIVRHSPEAEAVVSEAARVVRDVIEA